MVIVNNSTSQSLQFNFKGRNFASVHRKNAKYQHQVRQTQTKLRSFHFFFYRQWRQPIQTRLCRVALALANCTSVRGAVVLTYS